jgi:hypothetical protein
MRTNKKPIGARQQVILVPEITRKPSDKYNRTSYEHTGTSTSRLRKVRSLLCGGVPKNKIAVGILTTISYDT